jgi:hypothetical protein
MAKSMSFCPFVWNNSAPIGRIFIKFDILSIFRKSVDNIQVLLTSDKNNGHLTQRPKNIYNISLNSS